MSWLNDYSYSSSHRRSSESEFKNDAVPFNPNGVKHVPAPKPVIIKREGKLTHQVSKVNIASPAIHPNATLLSSFEAENKKNADKGSISVPNAPSADLEKRESIPISISNDPPTYEIAKNAPSIKLETLPPPPYESSNSDPPSYVSEKPPVPPTEAPEPEDENELVIV